MWKDGVWHVINIGGVQSGQEHEREWESEGERKRVRESIPNRGKQSAPLRTIVTVHSHSHSQRQLHFYYTALWSPTCKTALSESQPWPCALSHLDIPSTHNASTPGACSLAPYSTVLTIHITYWTTPAPFTTSVYRSGYNDWKITVTWPDCYQIWPDHWSQLYQSAVSYSYSYGHWPDWCDRSITGHDRSWLVKV